MTEGRKDMTEGRMAITEGYGGRKGRREQRKNVMRDN
jgi:hypothetical protein